MGAAGGGSMPRAGDDVRARFRALLPPDAAVSVRPMFGNLAAFVNGNMFAGLFGEDLFVRLSDAERERALASGGSEFQPMPGRAMKGYVTLPPAWREEPESARAWIAGSLDWSRRLPPKPPRSHRA